VNTLCSDAGYVLGCDRIPFVGVRKGDLLDVMDASARGMWASIIG
jgi:hypothetical protein